MAVEAFDRPRFVEFMTGDAGFMGKLFITPVNLSNFSAKLKPTSYGRGHVSWLCRSRMGMAYGRL